MNAAQRRQSDSPALHVSATGVAHSAWGVAPLTQATSPPGNSGPDTGGPAAGTVGGRSAGSCSDSTSGSSGATSPTSSTANSATAPSAASSAGNSSGGEAADPRPLTEREWERLRRRAALLRDLAEAKDQPFALRVNQIRRRRKALRRAM